MIVADSSPLITFARNNQLTLLKKIVNQLIIPQAVFNEIVIKEEKPGAKEIKSSAWIKTQAIQNKTELTSFPFNFGQGEKEAIILAQELNAILLIDDYRPRKEAAKRGLKTISSITILQEAKEKSLIPEVKELLDNFIQAGFYISNELYKTILMKVGEL